MTEETDNAMENSRKFGNFVAEAMDAMEQDMPDAKLGEVLVICEFQRETEEGQGFTTTRYVCTDPRAFLHIGLLRTALLSAEGAGE